MKVGTRPTRTPTKTPSKLPTRTPTKSDTKPDTPVRTPRRKLLDIEVPASAKRTPTKTSQVNIDLDTTVTSEQQYTSFRDITAKRQIRVLSLPRNSLTSFDGLKNFPNLRVIDLRDNPVEFSVTAILVAFRSLSIKTVNGVEVGDADFEKAFQYSAIVTHALRHGMSPLLKEDPQAALQDACEFMSCTCHQNDSQDGFNTIEIEGAKTWYVLNEDFEWDQFATETSSVTTQLNSPLMSSSGGDNAERFVVPEYDGKYHVHAELTGKPVEGGILSVKAPLSATIEWKHADDGEVLKSGTLIFPVGADSVGRVLTCEVTPLVGKTVTKLLTSEVKPGEFRFRSLRLQGQLVENDEIEFEISTKGTKATFKGVRVLRSARHGEWENIDFIPAEQEDGVCQLKYRLTVQDIGCVIRAVCVTEGGGPPLMLTSNERVQPSAPHFVSANIYGSMKVGMPLFAIAQYEGGIQGNCKYEWSIGGSKGRPVIVPKESDIGKSVSCIMTPIRNDGSIGQQKIVQAPNVIERADRPMTERFLQFHKKTRSGKLQMSFVDKPASDQLFIVHEGETIIISTACDWAVVDSRGIHPMSNSKTFTAEAGHVKGIIVVFDEDSFALVGQIEAAQPTASDVEVVCDKSSAFLTVRYQYYGGVEGRSIIQWNRNDGGKTETVAAFGRSYHVSLSDRGCTYRAIVTPVSLDGKRGTPTSSDPYFIDDSCVTFDERPVIEMIEPESVIEDVPIKIVSVRPGTTVEPEDNVSLVQLTTEITKRQIVVWLYKGKIFLNGPLTYTPTKDDVGKVFTIQLRDRIRENIICECQLPAVDGQDPRVENVRLSIENIPGTRKHRVTVRGDYHGGVEGNSIIIWRAKTPDDEEPKEVARTNQKWVEIDDSFEGAMIGVIYVPMSTTQEKPGHKVESEMIQVPYTQGEPLITVTSATIVPNPEYTTLTCVIKTRGKGSVTYNWGYEVNGEQQFTEEYEKVHQITEDDFDYPLFCHVQPLAPDGTLADEVFVYMDPPIQELFTPTIVGATIEPCAKGSDPALMQGQELKVVLDYHGPPIHSTIVRWQREVGEDEWKTLIDSETYMTSINDVDCRIRAIVAVQATTELLSEPISSSEFTTPAVLISKTNPTVKRLASTMMRTGRAQFDAVLPMGEPVSACVECGSFFIKSGANVLMRSPLAGVSVEARDSAPCTALIKARHGYNTELTFKEKKMKGGMKFTAEQTRDLFVVTLRSFLGK